MPTTRCRPKLVVSADGHGVVSHAGSRLLADLADSTTLTSAFSDALGQLRPRGTGHDPGRVAVDLAVMLADGGEAIRDLAVLRDQADVFGAVASTPTAWRVPAGIDTAALNALRAARATAREFAWLQAFETGRDIPPSHAGGRELPGLVLDIDATLVTCHSEKEQAAATYKRGFGYHPMLCFLDNTGEALAGLLRSGNAGANTAADHISVLDQALAQIPDAHRHGTEILIRADSAGKAPKPSSPTCAPCDNAESTPPSPSDTSSPTRSARQSARCPTRCGTPHWNRTVPLAPAPRSPN